MDRQSGVGGKAGNGAVSLVTSRIGVGLRELGPLSAVGPAISRAFAERNRSGCAGCGVGDSRKLFAFLEKLPVGVFVTTATGEPHYANREAERILGRGVVRGIGAADLPAAYDAYLAGTDRLYPVDRLPIAQALGGRTAHVDDMEIAGPDGRVPVEVWGLPVHGADGAVEYAVIAFADVSRRKAAERALAYQEALLDLTHDAIFTRDLTGRITYWSQGAESMYGFFREEAEGRVAGELLRTRFPVPAGEVEAEVLGVGRWEGEMVHYHQDGHAIAVEGRLAAHRDADGTLLGTLEICRDVTARKAAEAELARRAAELERSERQLADAQALVHLGSWEWDIDSNVVRWSTELYRIFGHDAGTFVPSYESFLACVDREDRARVAAEIGAAVAVDAAYHCVYRIVRPDGERRWIDTMGHAVPGVAPGGRLYVGTAHDITERRRTEDQLRFQAHLLDAVGEAVVATDLSGTILYWGPGAVQLYGWSSEEALGRSLFEVVPMVTTGGTADEVLEALAAGRGWSGVVELRRRDGATFLADVTGTAVYDGDGKLAAVIGISSDVTERETARAAMERLLAEQMVQAREQAAALDLGRAALAGQPAHDIVQQAITAVAETLGIDRCVVVAYRDADHVLVPEATYAVAAAVESPAPVPVLPGSAWPGALSRNRPLHLDSPSCQELFGAATAGTSGVWATITARHRVFGAIAAATDDPARGLTDHDLNFVASVATVLGSVIEREELDRLKSEFVSTVSHELRTPLSSVLGYLELLRSGEAGDLTADQRQMLDVIARNGERLLTLVQDLLACSRIDAGTMKLSLAPVDVAGLLDRSLQAVGRQLDGRDLGVEVDVERHLGPIAGDAEQLERTLVNLLVNAVKFTPDGGRVVVRAAAARDRSAVEIDVADTGIGIPDDEQPHLFQRFFRASTARDAAIQGTGLGLSIVKSIVEAHGGTVEVTSAPGVGTTVRVRLPLFGSSG